MKRCLSPCVLKGICVKLKTFRQFYCACRCDRGEELRIASVGSVVGFVVASMWCSVFVVCFETHSLRSRICDGTLFAGKVFEQVCIL